MKHLNITVKGKVQRVQFRAATKAVADQLGVRGYVKNQPDGSVFIEAEGDTFALDAFIDFCKEGPEDAEVADIHIEELSVLNGFKNFVVLKRAK